jgi:hypothetical protein
MCNHVCYYSLNTTPTSYTYIHAGNEHVDWDEFTEFCVEVGRTGSSGSETDFIQDEFFVSYHEEEQPLTPDSTVADKDVEKDVDTPPDVDENTHTDTSSSMMHTSSHHSSSSSSSFSSGRRKAKPEAVAFMTYIPESRIVYTAAVGSATLQALDSCGRQHHSYTFSDPLFVEGATVAVLSVALVPPHSESEHREALLAVACSDHSVNYMREVRDK